MKESKICPLFLAVQSGNCIDCHCLGEACAWWDGAACAWWDGAACACCLTAITDALNALPTN